MKIFGQVVRTTVNLATLPVAIGKDIITLGNAGAWDEPEPRSFTVRLLEKLKREAEEER